MRIVNKTKNIVISEDAGLAISPLSRARGLMLSKQRDLVLVSPREDINSSSIHMFLMLYPIDVLWLDSGWVVVSIRKDIPPFNLLKPDTWRVYKPIEKARYVIELGVGDLGTTEIGDEIEFSHPNTSEISH